MRFISCIILLLMSSGSISAQFLLTEDFSGYTIGGSVENAADPANPDVGKWTFAGETAGSTLPSVINEQLAYPGYIYSAKGKAMSTIPSDGTRNIVFCLSTTHLPYPCQPEGNFTDGSNEFYTAFILDLSATSASTTQEIFSYYQLASNGRRGSLFYKLSSDKKTVAFSFQKKPDAPSTSWTKYFDKAKPFLFVVKYSHVCVNEKNLGHSEFELYVNPNPAKTEEENNMSKLSAFGNDAGYDTDLRYINFRQSGETSMKIASVRIANSFEHVLRGPDDTGITSSLETDFIFCAKNKTLFPNKYTNGKLSIYDVSSRLLCSYDVHGERPIETALDAGIYFLLYDEGSEQYKQKILIR